MLAVLAKVDALAAMPNFVGVGDDGIVQINVQIGD
jgi:hypothetical protein